MCAVVRAHVSHLETCYVALNAQTDLDCGGFYQSNLVAAVQSGAVNESVLDSSLVSE
jgi:hypothetical protein